MRMTFAQPADRFFSVAVSANGWHISFFDGEQILDGLEKLPVGTDASKGSFAVATPAGLLAVTVTEQFAEVSLDGECLGKVCTDAWRMSFELACTELRAR